MCLESPQSTAVVTVLQNDSTWGNPFGHFDEALAGNDCLLAVFCLSGCAEDVSFAQAVLCGPAWIAPRLRCVKIGPQDMVSHTSRRVSVAFCDQSTKGQ